MSEIDQPSPSPRVFGRDVPKTLFILRHRFQKSPQDFEEAYQGHRAYIDRNMADGTFLLAGPAVPWDGGVILARAADRATIEAVVATDPLIAEGITEYTVTEWKTTVRRSEFDAIIPA
ncbi:YciI family protein [Actinoplanes sp. NPDC049265]|uniref:YciI family protein n=1 Tax=Actinoplanes sp. NPDC049265 TaxID=3363902 RepID=UPI0037147E0E